MDIHHYPEETAQFNRERIPERVRVNRPREGWRRVRTFTVTNDEISEYTMVDILSEGRETDLFIRFSTVGSCGSRTPSATPAASR
jgi:catalase